MRFVCVLHWLLDITIVYAAAAVAIVVVVPLTQTTGIFDAYSLLKLYLFRLFCPIQNQFVVDDVSKIIKEAIENTIGGNAYQHDKVNHWTKTVVDNCLGVLTKLQKPYKYIGKMGQVH